MQRKELKRIGLLMILLTMIITQTGCGSDTEPVSVNAEYLDTSCNITVYGTGAYDPASGSADEKNALDPDAAEKAIEEAYKLCAELDNMLSRTKESSEVSRINNAGGEWVEASDYTVELVTKGLEYSELSGGDFDITVGGVTMLWDFHALEPELPDAEALKAAAAHIDYTCVQIDGNRIRLTDPDAMIDLGGIAKGYIGDKMAECLIENGVNSAIVNLGGNVICIGRKPDGVKDSETFSIGIETPYSDRTEINGVIQAENETLVTSGVYERFFEIDGTRYHHILSTETGYPVDSDVIAVTLTAEIGHSADIDALSTICLIKGSDEGKTLIESIDGVEASFLLTNGERVSTSGIKLTAV